MTLIILFVTCIITVTIACMMMLMDELSEIKKMIADLKDSLDKAKKSIVEDDAP